MPVTSGAVPVPAKGITLDTSIQYLKGMGPQRSALFKRLGIETLRDLVYHFPRRHEDRRVLLPIIQLKVGEKQTVHGRVASASVFRAKTGTVILQVTVKDGTGSIAALWFNQPYMRRWFVAGQEIILYGMVEAIGRRLQMLVPEFELIQAEPAAAGTGKPVQPSLHMGRVVPIYPATSGLYQRELRNAMAGALKAILPTLQDPIPAEIRERHQLTDFPTAMKRIHFPPLPEAVAEAQARLTFDELLCFQLALGMRRRSLKARPGIAHQVAGDLVTRWKAALPFQLTAAQEKVIAEISADMANPRPMHRLLQGEVGAGKTVVAAYAMVVAIQNGFQAAILAPTEVLARQHAITLSQLLAPIDVQVRLLTGSLEEVHRKDLAQELASGAVQVLVGTHALLEPWVTFQKLGLAVVDEQQKFGVDQRNKLMVKGAHPDLLILTATPIPRTLALTLYGEMEISTIAQKPVGRQPVRTLWMDSTRKEEVYAFVKSELDAGRQAYVVCPRIGKTEGEADPAAPPAAPKSDLFINREIATATKMFEEYQRIFTGYKVALLHGRMSPAEQKAVFAAFKQKQIQLLVATQVIEVGIDVPNANLIVIEGAERFGLAQLHQLRGRVGRGQHESTCILVADPKDPAGVERMQTIVGVADAFKIAEEDLRLRGPGELLGKRQAGLPDLKCLAWATHGPWLEITRDEAERLLQKDPTFLTQELSALKKEVAFRFPQLMVGTA